MRLIDADKLTKEMSKWYWDKEKQKAAEEDASPMDLFTHLAITTVQEQPTVFDLDKISKEIPKKPITYPGTNRANCPVCMKTVRGIGKPFEKGKERGKVAPKQHTYVV